MRKTFKFFCAAAVAALTVSSCGKIWDEFDEVHGQLDSIEARLDSLETALNSQVATINTKIGALEAADAALKAKDEELAASLKTLNEALDALDGTVDGYITSNDAALKAAIEELKAADEKLAGVDTEVLAALAGVGVTNVAKDKDGNVVLTFTDKTQITVPANANVNNTGLVTVVDGKWAVVGADGKTTVLEAEVHPDTQLDFKVEENTLFVSYDGGETWEKTDVVVNDETTINVVEAFEYTEGDAFVTLTVGGKEYVLPVYVADNSSLVLGRPNAFFAYGISKKIELTAEDIEEYYVMSKPDGWKASIEGTTLTVTAPAEEVVNMGAGEAEGEVLVHATTLTGTCKVVKLDVTTGPGLTLSYKDGNITLFTAMTESSLDPWTGEKFPDFAQIMIGATTFEEYRTYGSFKSFLESRPDEYQELKDCFGNILTIASNSLDMETWFIEGEREELTLTLPLDEVAAGAWPPVELDSTKNYVVWAVPSTSEGFLFDSAVYATTGNDIGYVASNSVYNNADIALDLFGADGYYVGAVNKTYLEAFFGDWGLTAEETLEYYLVNGTMGAWGAPSGPFSKFLEGSFKAMGQYVAPGQHTLKLKDILLADQENEPANEYYVWILPYYEGQPAAEYDIKDLIVKECETAPMVKNDALKPEMTIIPGFEKVTYIITPPANGKTVHEVFDVESFEMEYMKVDTLKEVELKNWLKWNEPVVKKDTIDNTWSIEAGKDYVIATYTTVEGEYAFSVEKFTAPLYDSPDKKQWLFKSEYMDMMVEGENSSYCLDLGVAWADLDIESLAGATVIGVDYGTIPMMAESGAPLGSWFPAFPAYAPSVVTPTDAESGIVTFLGCDLPYSEFDGETCTFDFSELLGEDSGTVVFECTLAEELVPIQAQ